MTNTKGLGKKCKFVKGPESGALGVLLIYPGVEREKRYFQRKTEKGNEPRKRDMSEKVVFFNRKRKKGVK